VKQVASAVAVRAAETDYGFAVFADFGGDEAFFRFTPLPVQHFHDFGSVTVQQVVNMPKLALFSSEMPLHSLLQIVLGRANVSVQTLLES
jgi:hypothetical protein